jgi:hypothetical protein
MVCGVLGVLGWCSWSQSQSQSNRRLRLLGYSIPQIECSIPDFNPEAVARDIIQLPTDAFQEKAILDWCDGYVDVYRAQREGLGAH